MSSTQSSASESRASSGAGYSFSSSRIVRVAVAAGIIVLVLTILVLFFKVSSWIRYRQSTRRQHALTNLLATEQKTRAYELAAWADDPGQAPVEPPGVSLGPRPGGWLFGKSQRRGRGRDGASVPTGKTAKSHKRGITNAYAVHEWEGTPL